VASGGAHRDAAGGRAVGSFLEGTEKAPHGVVST
jgi:hypothetical protein